jgi:hypothetical protein
MELLFIHLTKTPLKLFYAINCITSICTLIGCYFLHMANFLFCENFKLVKAYNPNSKNYKLKKISKSNNI